jgi:hypothetical protein
MIIIYVRWLSVDQDQFLMNFLEPTQSIGEKMVEVNQLLKIQRKDRLGRKQKSEIKPKGRIAGFILDEFFQVNDRAFRRTAWVCGKEFVAEPRRSIGIV